MFIQIYHQPHRNLHADRLTIALRPHTVQIENRDLLQKADLLIVIEAQQKKWSILSNAITARALAENMNILSISPLEIPTNNPCFQKNYIFHVGSHNNALEKMLEQLNKTLHANVTS